MGKGDIIKALIDMDLPRLREISNYFYNTNGLYRNMCHYFAFMYRYDWYVGPEIIDNKNLNEEKIIKDFYKLLSYFDNSELKRLSGEIALKVIKDGAYYAYIIPSAERLILQELPVKYCRVRYNVGLDPAVEFNMRFFDDYFSNPAYRIKVLKLFPKEFAKGYALYKQGKLISDFPGETSQTSWYLLTPGNTIKFSMYGNLDVPLFVNVIPKLIDLDAAQDLDRRKQMQQLLKILIQKLPLDKNGDLIFDIDEAADLHRNAVEMLRNAIGVDVLTTFADISVEDMADTNTTTTSDDLKKVERSVFNAFGSSSNIFNAEGNLALANSILQDESTMRNLLLQFNSFYGRVAQAFSVNRKKYNFKLYMLETTQYNYKEISKMYKEQTQIGYSKMLPQIALGQSQSFILHSAKFENEILELSSIMIPPVMSSTLNGEQILGKNGQNNNNNNQKNTELIGAGRPEKDDTQKSDKTLANQESMS